MEANLAIVILFLEREIELRAGTGISAELELKESLAQIIEKAATAAELAVDPTPIHPDPPARGCNSYEGKAGGRPKRPDN